MDYRILDLFMKENDAWEDMISRQKVEIPLLDKMISNIIEGKEDIREEISKGFQHLKNEMLVQTKKMEELGMELAKQQQFLVAERKRATGDPYSINTLFSQKILRERIKDVERHFVELKCNYLNYVATI